jgi:anti-sigma factor RsiW
VLRALGFFLAARVLAASLLALAASAGLHFARPTHRDRLAEELVASHLRSLQVNQLSAVAATDRYTVKPQFNGKIDCAAPVVDLAAQGFALEGGHLDDLRGRAVAVLVYRHGPQPINRNVWPSRLGDTPPLALDRQGHHLTGWTVSNLARDEMANLVAALRRQR